MIITRYFRCTLGNHDKFWNISLQDRAYIVRFGRNGTVGQERVKTFISDLRARIAFDLKIGEKLGKGYYEVTEVGYRAERSPAIPHRKKAEERALRQPKRAISFD